MYMAFWTYFNLASDYRTETELIKLLNDIHLNTDSGKTHVLVGLVLLQPLILWTSDG